MKNDILEDTTFTIKTSFTYLNVCLLFSRIQQQFSVGIKNQPESYASTFLSEFQTVICTLWFLSLTYIVHNLFFYYGSHTTRELFQRSTLKPIQINNPYEVSPPSPQYIITLSVPSTTNSQQEYIILFSYYYSPLYQLTANIPPITLPIHILYIQ